MSDSGVELVYFTGCPNTDKARENIRSAFRETGRAEHWVEWDLEDGATPEALPSIWVTDRARGWKGRRGRPGGGHRALVQCRWRPFHGADRDSVRRRRIGGSNGRDTAVKPPWSRSNLRSPAAFPLLKSADLIRRSGSGSPFDGTGGELTISLALDPLPASDCPAVRVRAASWCLANYGDGTLGFQPEEALGRVALLPV